MPFIDITLAGTTISAPRRNRLHREATYVVIHEVSADAWGYGGRTQKDRAGTL